MGNLDYITFDEVMKKANEAGWRRLKETRESKDTYYTCLLYYAEVKDFYVVLNNFYSGGIFWNCLHKVELTDSSYFKLDFCVSYPLITFAGSKYKREGRRREKILRTLEDNLSKFYRNIDEQYRLEELDKKKREEKALHDNLRETFS